MGAGQLDLVQVSPLSSSIRLEMPSLHQHSQRKRLPGVSAQMADGLQQQTMEKMCLPPAGPS